MRKLLAYIVLFSLALMCTVNLHVIAQTTQSVDAPKLSDVSPGILYLKFHQGQGIDIANLSPTHTGNAQLDQLFTQLGVKAIQCADPEVEHPGIGDMFIIQFSTEGNEPRATGHLFLKLPAVELVAPQYILTSYFTPNDPQVPVQYALDNMHLKDAWGLAQGTNSMLIADIDLGVNYNHEDLKGNIYQFSGHSGYDVVGDATPIGTMFSPDFDPYPGAGLNHGTMTSGCFGATTDNSIGMAGSAYQCKILAIKIANNAGILMGGYQGIKYAITHNAKILSCSWGFTETDPAYIAFWQALVNEVLDSNCLLVAAAGNDGKNNTTSGYFPTNLKGVLSVGASDNQDRAALKINTGTFATNYGSLVNVYAPGVQIYSTSLPRNTDYSVEDGTSFSCPLTAGVAGLVWNKHPDWQPKFVSRQIIETCDNVINPTDRTNYWGRVNAYTALSKATVPGLNITMFAVDNVPHGSLKYADKIYNLDVTLKNVMADGSGLVATLVPVPGSDPTYPSYTIQKAVASLGTMTSGQSVTASFKFTRDTNDDQAGGKLKLAIAISYGNSTVGGKKYTDTIPFYIDIIGDDAFPTKSVGQNHYSETLSDCFPNPVAGEATINFELSQAGIVKLGIYDALGRSVMNVADGMLDAGAHRTSFDTRSFVNGTYFYRLETSEGAMLTKRMVVVH
ncbi:MAG: S8 family serine peptidase [bacterium]